MARLTLEALEQRDLLSANPLAQTIAPPAPVAPCAITIYDCLITSVVESSPLPQQRPS